MKLLKHLLLCVFLLSVIGCVSPPDPTLTVVRYNYYFVLLPQDYEGQGDCPMIFYLHGEGYETTDLGVLTSYGLGKYVEEHGDFPFVVVAPVYTQDWETELLDQVLDEVTAEYHIDLDRIYVTGFDWGGRETYALAIAFPDRFAAIAPVAGWGDPEKAETISHLPVWIFHNDEDPVAPIENAQAMYDSLLAHGADVRLTVYSSDSHNAWDAAYSDSTLYAWFLSYARVNASP